MRTYFYGLALIMFGCSNIKAQNTTEEKIFILKLLSNEAPGTENIIKKNTSQKPFSLKINNAEGSYTVKYEMLGHTDLNSDKVNDYVVLRTSESEKNGSMNTNGQILFYLMKNKTELLKSYKILTYAPFSYNILSDVKMQNGKVTAKAEKNFRNYPDAEKYTPVPLSFSFKDSRLYEESYLSQCKLGVMKNKQVLKAGLPNSTQIHDIDMDNYVELVTEKAQNKDWSFEAMMSGCDNRNIYLAATTSDKNTAAHNKSAKKEYLSVIAQWAEISNYKTLLDQLYNKLDTETQFTGSDDIFEGKLSDEWSYSLFPTDTDTNGKTCYIISLQNTTNPNQTENWGITTRQK